MDRRKPLRKIYRESEDETAKVGVHKRHIRKMMREMSREIVILQALTEKRDRDEKKERIESEYEDNTGKLYGYHFTASVFLSARIILATLLLTSFPFLFIATKETLPLFIIFLVFASINEGFIRMLKIKY